MIQPPSAKHATLKYPSENPDSIGFNASYPLIWWALSSRRCTPAGTPAGLRRPHPWLARARRWDNVLHQQGNWNVNEEVSQYKEFTNDLLIVMGVSSYLSLISCINHFSIHWNIDWNKRSDNMIDNRMIWVALLGFVFCVLCVSFSTPFIFHCLSKFSLVFRH